MVLEHNIHHYVQYWNFSTWFLCYERCQTICKHMDFEWNEHFPYSNRTIHWIECFNSLASCSSWWVSLVCMCVRFNIHRKNVIVVFCYSTCLAFALQEKRICSPYPFSLDSISDQFACIVNMYSSCNFKSYLIFSCSHLSEIQNLFVCFRRRFPSIIALKQNLYSNGNFVTFHVNPIT